MSREKKHSVYEAKTGTCLFTKQFDEVVHDNWNTDIAHYFKRLNKIKDERSFVILASTVLEYQLDSFLKLFIPESQILVNEKTNFDSKIKIIRAFNLIPPQLINIAELIKNIRNQFAHDLYLDKFEDGKKTEKLPKLLKLLDNYWTQYEDDMTYNKIKATTLQKYKDLMRVSLQGIRVYENNIRLFRQVTEKPEFINELNQRSTILRKEREAEFQKNIMKYMQTK